jgi:heat shock protein HslJ
MGSRRIAAAAALGIAIAVAGCAGAGADAGRLRSPSAVVGKAWQWEVTATPAGKIEVPQPERYTFELQADGKVVARFDCNRGGGSYKIGDGTISFSPLASTRAACPPDSLDARFARDLGAATRFFVEGGRLYLDLPADGGTMRFRPAR